MRSRRTGTARCGTASRSSRRASSLCPRPGSRRWGMCRGVVPERASESADHSPKLVATLRLPEPIMGTCPRRATSRVPRALAGSVSTHTRSRSPRRSGHWHDRPPRGQDSNRHRGKPRPRPRPLLVRTSPPALVCSYVVAMQGLSTVLGSSSTRLRPIQISLATVAADVSDPDAVGRLVDDAPSSAFHASTCS